MESVQTAADALLRLEEPFASKDVKWLVAATSRDGRKGRVTPYADPRAYTDRLNHIFTASGWTREYSVHTVSPVTNIIRRREKWSNELRLLYVTGKTVKLTENAPKESDNHGECPPEDGDARI